jgi:Phage integrase, N-terminal SAM-like domain
MPSQAQKGGEGATSATNRQPKLLEQVRQVMRLHHYSLHTERTYVEWIRRFIHFHRMQSREELAGGEAKIEAFLTDLAVNGKVAAATQNPSLLLTCFSIIAMLPPCPANSESSILADSFIEAQRVRYSGWYSQTGNSYQSVYETNLVPPIQPNLFANSQDISESSCSRSCLYFRSRISEFRLPLILPSRRTAGRFPRR